MNNQHSESTTTANTCTTQTSSHPKKKSPQEILHPLTFNKIVEQSFKRLSEDECYPSSITSQFKLFRVESVSSCYQLIIDVVTKFKGDSERFYPDFCALFKNSNVFEDLDHSCNVLIGFDLANHVLSYLTNSKIVDDALSIEFKSASLSEKEKSIVAYLSGYVVGTFYRRIRF
jgi:hypothetical protein